MNLSAWALRNQSLTRYLMIVLLSAGIWSYFNLGQREDPDFTIKTMIVNTRLPGASAEQIQKQLTDPIEAKLQETPFLDNIKSYSKAGESMIFVELKDFTNPKLVPDIWYQVRKKLGDIKDNLPEGVQGPYPNDEFGDTFGSIYAFTSDGFTYAETKKYIDKIREELLKVESVSKVEIIGSQDEKIFIEMSPQKMASLAVSPQAFISALQAKNALIPSGDIQTNSSRLFVRVNEVFQSVEQIENTVININNKPIRIKDVASKVYKGYEDPTVFKMRFMGKEAIGLAISMTKDGDVLKLGDGLTASMTEIKKKLPVGIEIHQVSDQPRVVKSSVKEFIKFLVEAIVIVLAVSFISLGWRTGIVVALCIPIVLAMTFLGMKIFGIELQRISLGALIIALGLLVDDAIIAVEMMALKLEQGWDRMKSATFAYSSTAFPMLTGTLITTAGFLPVAFAKSAAGEYTFSIFAVVGTALIASWIVAVLFTPYIGYKLLPENLKDAHHNEDDDVVYNTKFYKIFKKILNWCLTHAKTVLAMTFTAFVLSLVCFKLFVAQQFFPSSARPELTVDLWLPEGSSYKATEAEVKRVEKLLTNDPNVENFVSYVGSGTPHFYLPLNQELRNLNFGQMVVMTKNLESREIILKKLNNAFDKNSEFSHIRGRANRLENGPPVGYPVSFRIAGDNIDLVKSYALQIADLMRKNPKMRHVHLDWNQSVKSIRLIVDEQKTQTLGLNSQDIERSLNMMLRGFSATKLREDNKQIDIIVRTENNYRDDISKIKDLLIYTQKGEFVPVGQIAKLDYDFEEAVIWRRQRTPTITVRGDIIDGVQAPDVTNELIPVLKPIQDKLPFGYSLVPGGTFESSAKSQKSIGAVFPMMLLVIITLLMLQLRSFQKTTIVLLTAPLGLIGVTLFLILLNRPFGFVAMLGVFALAGMIMRNSVILIDQIEQDLAQGIKPYDAVVGSAVRRFRPIMLTAAAAILAMIPLTESTFWGPMAVAIMGGLFVATILTLTTLPAIYVVWFKIKPDTENPHRPISLNKSAWDKTEADLNS